MALLGVFLQRRGLAGGFLQFVHVYQGLNFEAPHQIVHIPLTVHFQPLQLVIYLGHVLVVHEVVVVGHHQYPSLFG